MQDSNLRQAPLAPGPLRETNIHANAMRQTLIYTHIQRGGGSLSKQPLHREVVVVWGGSLREGEIVLSLLGILGGND